MPARRIYFDRHPLPEFSSLLTGALQLHALRLIDRVALNRQRVRLPACGCRLEGHCDFAAAAASYAGSDITGRPRSVDCELTGRHCKTIDEHLLSARIDHGNNFSRALRADPMHSEAN